MSTFKVFSPHVLSENTTVSELKLTHGKWNEGLVRSSFLEEDADTILSIPLSNSGLDDRLIWHFDKSCNFSVKSGY